MEIRGSYLLGTAILAGVAVTLDCSGYTGERGRELVEMRSQLDDQVVDVGTTAEASAVRHEGQWAIRLAATGDGGDTLLTFRRVENRTWDLSSYGSVDFRVTNTGTEPVVVWGRAANPDGEENRDQTRNAISISPGASDLLRVRLVRRPKIGYFVDNELGWLWRPRAAHVGQVAIQRGRGTGSKLKFVEMLREKYGSVEDLNAAWDREHESWDALIDCTEEPDMGNPIILEDCGDFGMAFAEHYFSHTREVLDDVAPNHLYLGVRFHGHIDRELVALASRYIDVVSYNIYDNTPSGRANQYREIDVPILIGEFSTGNNMVQTPFRYEGELSPRPEHRTEGLERYLQSAFSHPMIVGAHFFQYRDQPLTGRADGEAGTRGFINATDTPHFDMIQTNRRLAYELYRIRMDR